MKKYLFLSILISILLTYTSGIKVNPTDYEVPYPEGYRRWTHVKTKMVGPKSVEFNVNAGRNHTYANAQAMDGYLTGQFPEGSVVIFDVMLVKDDSLHFNTKEWKRKRIDVMIKDSIKYVTTGGWGYGQFLGDSKIGKVLTLEEKTKCFTCHTSQKDFVFSEFRN